MQIVQKTHKSNITNLLYEKDTKILNVLLILVAKSCVKLCKETSNQSIMIPFRGPLRKESGG